MPYLQMVEALQHYIQAGHRRIILRSGGTYVGGTPWALVCPAAVQFPLYFLKKLCLKIQKNLKPILRQFFDQIFYFSDPN